VVPLPICDRVDLGFAFLGCFRLKGRGLTWACRVVMPPLGHAQLHGTRGWKKGGMQPEKASLSRWKKPAEASRDSIWREGSLRQHSRRRNEQSERVLWERQGGAVEWNKSPVWYCHVPLARSSFFMPATRCCHKSSTEKEGKEARSGISW